MGGVGKPRKVDFALCAATSHDLDAALAQGRFRRDFLERIRGATLHVRSLDDRRDEIPFLLASFPKLTTSGRKLSAFFVEACVLRSWPGNVRHLHNGLTDALVTAGVESSSEVLPRHLEAGSPRGPQLSADDLERAQLLDALRLANGNAVEAAKAAGIPRSTFYDRLAKHGIKRR